MVHPLPHPSPSILSAFSATLRPPIYTKQMLGSVHFMQISFDDCYFFCQGVEVFTKRKVYSRRRHSHKMYSKGLRKSANFYGNDVNTLLFAVPLAKHLGEQDAQFIQFAFRWMNCFLMREIPLPLIARMWDTYLAEGPTGGFGVFHVVCLPPHSFAF